MADSNIQLNADGTGKKLDTRTESTNNEHRQVFVVGDPSNNAGVAPVDATKGLAVDLSNTGANVTALKVDNSGVTQPVSAASLPLPTGAATSAKQAAPGTAGSASTDVLSIQGVASMTPVKTDPSGVTSPVSVAALPLPTGASTAANQATGNTSLSSIDGKLVTSKTDDYDTGAGTDTVQSVGIALPASGGHVVGGTSSNPLRTDPTGTTTQPVSGSVSISSGSVSLSGTSNINQSTIAGNSIDVNSGLKSAGTQRVVIATDQPSLTNALPISASSLPLPTGAATSTNQTNGSQLTQLTDGTNTANMLNSDGTAAGQNAALTAGTYLSVPFTTTTAQAVGTTDAGNYASVSVYISSQGTSSTVTFQGSNDNSNWTSIALQSAAAGQTYTNSTTSSALIFAGSLNYRYFRLNVTGISAGTTAGTIVFSTHPYVNPSLNAFQGGTWSVGSNSATGSAVPANAFYIAINSASGNLTGLQAVSQLGDGMLGNSTIGVPVFNWNGASFDRGRGNLNTTTGDSGTKTASFAGATQTNYNARGAIITALLGAVSGTSPTLNMQLQWSPDGGTTWLNMGPATSNLTASSQNGVLMVYPTRISQAPGTTPADLTTGGNVTTAINMALPRTWRINYTIGGTTPSFAISSVQVNYIL